MRVILVILLSFISASVSAEQTRTLRAGETMTVQYDPYHVLRTVENAEKERLAWRAGLFLGGAMIAATMHPEAAKTLTILGLLTFGIPALYDYITY